MSEPETWGLPTRQPQLVQLPGGPSVWATSPLEARLLWRSITPTSSYHRAAQALSPGDVVVDIGANIGLTSIYWARLQPGLRIVAVEPAPDTLACLRRNAAQHLGQCDIVAAAAAASPGERSFTYYPNAPGNSSLLADRQLDDQITRVFLRNSGMSAELADMMVEGLHDSVELMVGTTTVSELIRRFSLERIALLKIDVERAELEVLLGIDEPDWGCVERVVAEVHDEDGRVQIFCGLLGKHGFQVEVHEEPLLAGTGMVEVVGVAARR